MLKFNFINRLYIGLTFLLYFFNFDLSFIIFPKICAHKIWRPMQMPMSPMPGAGPANYFLYRGCLIKVAWHYN